MRKFLVSGFIAGALFAVSAIPILADAKAPTNGGAANGAGQSGNCTGANADRPAACHNGHGAGN